MSNFRSGVLSPMWHVHHYSQFSWCYGRLFWPEFTIHDDCVLFAGFSKKSYQSFMESTRGDKRSVEDVLNHTHIQDLFPNVLDQATEDHIIYLGRLLKEMWSCKLARDFPKRRIVVSFPVEGINDLLDYEISFYQEHNAKETC